MSTLLVQVFVFLVVVVGVAYLLVKRNRKGANKIESI
jgi:septation ring formation regulator EzrA